MGVVLTKSYILFCQNTMVFVKGKAPWNKGTINIEGRRENHSRWKGESASYESKHSWVTREKGNPKKCEHCGSEDKKKYEWANIDHKYSRELSDYIRLCVGCHRKYDASRAKYSHICRMCGVKFDSRNPLTKCCTKICLQRLWRKNNVEKVRAYDIKYYYQK